MKRVEFLVNSVREVSRNLANPDGTSSVLDNTILGYLNEGQLRIQNLISSLKNVQKPFTTSIDIYSVASQGSYELPTRMSMSKQVQQVMYSSSGNESDFVLLRKLSMANIDLSESNFPFGYIVSNGSLTLIPTPSTSNATIRVFYERQVDDLDLRRGGILSVVGLTSTTFSAVTLSSLADSFETTGVPRWDQSSTYGVDYISVVTADGVKEANAIRVGTYSISTGVLTPASGWVFETTGDTITAGDYAVFGKYATTHSQLPDMCEPYLIQYAAMKVLEQQSSDDAVTKAQFVAQLESQILAQVKAQTGEIQPIPEANFQEWY